MNYKECEIAPFEGMYRIYEDGKVWSYKWKRFLKPQYVGRDYTFMKVLLVRGKVKKWFGVHRLVIHHWVSPAPDDGKVYVVKWKDGNTENNMYTNLEWVSHQKNMQRMRQERPWRTGREKGCEVSEATRRAMSKAKKKVIMLSNGQERVRCLGFEEAMEFLGTYRRNIYRAEKFKKKINGYRVRFIVKPNTKIMEDESHRV